MLFTFENGKHESIEYMLYIFVGNFSIWKDIPVRWYFAKSIPRTESAPVNSVFPRPQ